MAGLHSPQSPPSLHMELTAALTSMQYSAMSFTVAANSLAVIFSVYTGKKKKKKKWHSCNALDTGFSAARRRGERSSVRDGTRRPASHPASTGPALVSACQAAAGRTARRAVALQRGSSLEAQINEAGRASGRDVPSGSRRSPRAEGPRWLAAHARPLPAPGSLAFRPR